MRSQLAKAVDTKHDAHPVAPLLISIAEAAKALGIGRTTLYGLITGGRITPVRIGGRTLVPITEMQRFVSSLDAAGRPAPHPQALGERP
jgi:excisionase family DNA binding protein